MLASLTTRIVAMDDDANNGKLPATRDKGGRYVAGVSGNPAGKPRGCLNRATRAALLMLDGEAEALWRAEIELAKAGNPSLLRHCNDCILGRRTGQPVRFAMPRAAEAGDLAAAVGAILRAAAYGLVTPHEAESLARAAESGARAVAVGERAAAERLERQREEVEARLRLRACLLMCLGIREIDAEAGPLDPELRELCRAAMRIGSMAVAALAALPDSDELAEADSRFLAAHPFRYDREPTGIALAMAQAWQELAEYLDDYRMDRLEREITARIEAGEMPEPRYRTGLFERLLLGRDAPA
jgi:hypothetical protein